MRLVVGAGNTVKPWKVAFGERPGPVGDLQHVLLLVERCFAGFTSARLRFLILFVSTTGQNGGSFKAEARPDGQLLIDERFFVDEIGESVSLWILGDQNGGNKFLVRIVSFPDAGFFSGQSPRNHCSLLP